MTGKRKHPPASRIVVRARIKHG